MGLTIAAGILVFWGIGYGLPAVYLGDESYNVNLALYMGYTRDLNPRAWVYPSLLMYLLLGLYGVYFGLKMVFGSFTSIKDIATAILRDPTPLYLLGRILSALAATLTVPLTFIVGRKFFNQRVGIVAAILLIGVVPSVVQAHFIKNEPLMTFFIVASLGVLGIAMHSGRLRDFALAGSLAGLAAASKYNGVLFAIPLALGALDHATPRTWLIRTVSAGVCMFGAFILASPFVLLDFSTFWHQFQALDYFSLPRLGSVSVSPLTWWNVFVGELGWGMTIVFALGLIALAAQRSLKAIVVLSFPVLHFAFFALASPWQNIYWQIPIFPFLALGAGVFFDTIARRMPSPTLRRAFLIVCLGVILIYPLNLIVQYDMRASQPDTRTLAKEWVEANIPAESHILTNRGKYQSSFGVPLTESPESIKANYLESDALTNEGRVFRGADNYYRLLAEANTGLHPTYYITPILYDDFAGQSAEFQRAPPKPLQEYIEAGVQYVVLIGNGAEYEQALKDARFADFAKPYVALYHAVSQHGRLLHMIPASTERMGPAVYIYQVAP